MKTEDEMDWAPLRWLDCTIAIILTIGLLVGSTLNIFSLTYFTTMKTRNANHRYFKRLYSIISLNDIMICLGVFPVIEAAASYNRNSIIFTSYLFCESWSIFWYTAYQLSIILVAMLSISRLLLIKNMKYSLKPRAPWLVATASIICYIGVYIVPICLQKVCPNYLRSTLHCTFVPKPLSNGTRLYSVNDQTMARLYNFVTFGIAIICYITVCFSVIQSLLHLIRPSPNGPARQARNRQREAAITVIFMTLLYLVFNSVSTIAFVYLMVDYTVLNPVEMGVATVNDVKIRLNTRLYGDSAFLNQYTHVTCIIIGPCLNSMMNPLVYYFRVEGFRQYVIEICGTVRRKVSNLCRRKMVNCKNLTNNISDSNQINSGEEITNNSNAGRLTEYIA